MYYRDLLYVRDGLDTYCRIERYPLDHPLLILVLYFQEFCSMNNFMNNNYRNKTKKN